MSHLQPGLDIHVSPFNSHLTPIYIPQNASQFHPGPIWSHPGPKVCVSPPSRPHLTPIHIARFASHPHPGSTSSASRTQDLHLSFISVMSPLLSVRQDCNSPASRSHLTPSWFLNLCLTSIQYMSHPHPGPDIRVTSSFRSHLVSIQVLIQVPRMASHSMQVPSQLTQDTRLLFHLHPSNTSPEFGSQDSRFILTSFYVTFHRYTGPKIHASPLSRSRLTSSTFSTSFVTHLHPVCVSLPSRTWFKCIKVPICTHPLHWCCISHPSRSWEEHLNSIQITSLTHLGLQMCISPPSRSRLTSVQIPIFVSRLHTGRISPPFRSWRLHLSFIQVPSHPHPCLEICVSPLSISCLISIQVTRTAPLLHPGSPPSRPLDSYFTCNLLCPGLKNFTSSPSSSHSSPIHISKCASNLHSGLVSPLSRSEDSCLASIQVVSYLHVVLENCISAPWGSHLTLIEVSNFASRLHPGPFSIPSSFWNLHLTSIQVLFSSVPTPRFASHLHLGSNSRV